MCGGAVENEPYSLKFVPDHFKMQEICDKAVREDPYSLEFLPNWFVTREEVVMWYEGRFFFKWYDAYKKCKAQKAKIKEELMPIAWHPLRYWGSCVPEDKKEETRYKKILT